MDSLGTMMHISAMSFSISSVGKLFKTSCWREGNYDGQRKQSPSGHKTPRSIEPSFVESAAYLRKFSLGEPEEDNFLPVRHLR
jgi:hypothetical protein